MAGKDTVLEAKNILDSAVNRVENRVLSRSAELKARTVSLAQRIGELLTYLSTIMGGIAERIEEDKNIISYGPFLYVALYKDSFTLVRSKPYMITLSYRKGDGRIYLRTRNFKAAISPTILELQYLAMKINVDFGDVSDIEGKATELRYLLRRFGRIVEFQLLPIIEKRVFTR